MATVDVMGNGNGTGNGDTSTPGSQPTPVAAPTAVPTTPKPVTYAPEGGSGDPNPYASQTSANTRSGWTGGGQPLSVDIHRLGDYAVDMKDIADFEFHHQRMQLMIDATTKAWTSQGNTLPEAVWASEQFMHNTAEFTQYLQNLYNAVNNIAFAAQSVADCYSGTDGWSAADVNAVDFAFGDNVPKPAGWAYTDTKTWLDTQKQDNQSNQSPAQNSWISQQTTKSGNTTTTVSVNQLGQKQTVTVTTNPDGSSTMVITGVDGKTTTSTSQVQTVGDTQTTVTRQDGQVTGATTVVTADEPVPGGGGMLHVVTTTKLGADGKVTHRTVQSTYNGPQGPSTTTAEYDANGNLLSEVTVGPKTTSAPAGRDTTIQDANAYIDRRTAPMTDW